MQPGGLGPGGILSHELAHAFIRRASADRAPAWLHEGLAQWLEGRRMPRAAFVEAVGGRAAPSLPALDALFAARRTRAEARASYAQALFLVEHIVRARGEGAVACLVTRLGSARDFDDALRAETGIPESEWWRVEDEGRWGGEEADDVLAAS